jgi:hypothetical protein
VVEGDDIQARPAAPTLTAREHLAQAERLLKWAASLDQGARFHTTNSLANQAAAHALVAAAMIADDDVYWRQNVGAGR